MGAGAHDRENGVAVCLGVPAELLAMAGTVARLRAETAARLAEPTTTRDRAALDLLLLDLASVAGALSRAVDSAQWIEEDTHAQG